MKKIKHYLLLTLTILAVAVVPLTSSYAAKIDIDDANKDNCTNSGGTQKKDDKGHEYCSGGNSLTSVFSTVTNVMLFLVGAVAVIMLIVGGFRYVASNGDQNSVTGAKNTIMYALIGIVVAFLAFAAVNFVTSQLEKSDEVKKTTSSIQQPRILV